MININPISHVAKKWFFFHKQLIQASVLKYFYKIFLFLFWKICSKFCSIPATNIHQISPTLLKIQGGGAFGGYK